MKNPYEILKVSQNATKQEIAKALILAQRDNMKSKQYSPQELMLAQKQLLDPAKRLAADFIFPAKYKAKRATKIDTAITLQNIDLSTIDENAFDSLLNI
jgi:hypothetical protein